MSGQIFISYRREESRWLARSLYDRLNAQFDRKQIFMDIDAIALGEDFVKAIEATVAKCDVLIAIIGNSWLTSKDHLGGRRLDNPEDFVRMEIATALKREIRVIPVLFDGVLLPQSTDLPDELQPLVRRNALRINDTSFEGDCQRLVAAIRQVLDGAATEQREREKPERDEAGHSEKERAEAERPKNENVERDRAEAERGAKSQTPPSSKFNSKIVILRIASVICFIPGAYLAFRGITYQFQPNRYDVAGSVSGIAVGLALVLVSFWIWRSTLLKK